MKDFLFSDKNKLTKTNIKTKKQAEACQIGGIRMIYGCIRNIDAEKQQFSVRLQKGLEFIQNSDFSQLAEGRYEIDGDSIYATVADYDTEPKGHRRPEAHRKYIDIQYLAAGEELIGCSFLSEKNELLEDYDETRDLAFYKNAINEADVLLNPSVYAILLPSDVHRPGCAVKIPSNVRKVVVKIKL
ncbi:Toxin-antitoxin biofilm protein TabA [bioreactor metagenome]|uniref:Toxin-antitoxin biofilm protein TabA n=1 Tax=bioreactor metagenome TaxID=1076179 RepID=A0A645CCH0_9ZZZZ